MSSIPLNGRDSEILDALGELLQQRIPEPKSDYPAFVARLRTLPPGLRAMAATHELDVSIALDDLGWHFGNWPSLELARATAWGLRELGADEAARIFEQALELALPHWDQMTSLQGKEWTDWYRDSGLDDALSPLNRRMWKLLEPFEMGLMHYWVEYARRSPERLVDAP